MANRKKERKSIGDTLAYTYLTKIKRRMLCPSCKKGEMRIEKKADLWECQECGYKLSAVEFEDNFVFWFCDECDTYLNNQEGFDKNAKKHICINCGYENDISENNVKGICSDCGKIIANSDRTLCAECKQIRKEKAKEWLKTAGTVVGLAVAFAACVSAEAEQNEYKGYTYLPSEDDEASTVKCANCGNTDERFLWDEGDVVHCTQCGHRTWKGTWEDASVECPYCHRMRDAKAMYCRWCNDSTWLPSTQKEFEETDKILKEMGF